MDSELPGPQAFMTAAEVAAACGIALTTVYAYRRDDKLPPAVMIGRTPVWARQAIADWSVSRRGPGRPRRSPTPAASQSSPTSQPLVSAVLTDQPEVLTDSLEVLIDVLGARRCRPGQWPSPDVLAELTRSNRTVLIVQQADRLLVQLHLLRYRRGHDQAIVDAVLDFEPSEISRARNAAVKYLHRR